MEAEEQTWWSGVWQNADVGVVAYLWGGARSSLPQWSLKETSIVIKVC